MRHLGCALTFSIFLGSAVSSFAQAVPQGDSIAAHEQRAQQYLRERKPELARQELEIIAKAEPNNLGAQANLGVLLYFAGDVEQAAPHLRAALQLDPGQTKVQALLGFSEHRLGQVAAARQDLAACFDKLADPKVQKQAGLELIEIDTNLNDLAAAAPVVLRLKALAPNDPEVLFAAYRVFNDLSGESLLDLSLAAPESAQMHQAMAYELMRARDNNGVIANLRAALKADPHVPGGHFQLAQALEASTDPAVQAQAQEQYDLALQDNPRDDAALTHLGDLAAKKGDPSHAIARYKQALAMNAANLDAQVGLASQLNETGHSEEALPLLEAALHSDPTNMLAHFRLSAVYRKLHRPEDAKRELAEYTRLKDLKARMAALYQAMRTAPPEDKGLSPNPTRP